MKNAINSYDLDIKVNIPEELTQLQAENSLLKSKTSQWKNRFWILGFIVLCGISWQIWRNNENAKRDI